MYHEKFATNLRIWKKEQKIEITRKKFEQKHLRAPKYILISERKKWEDEGMDTYS